MIKKIDEKKRRYKMATGNKPNTVIVGPESFLRLKASKDIGAYGTFNKDNNYFLEKVMDLFVVVDMGSGVHDRLDVGYVERGHYSG